MVLAASWSWGAQRGDPAPLHRAGELVAFPRAAWDKLLSLLISSKQPPRSCWLGQPGSLSPVAMLPTSRLPSSQKDTSPLLTL